MHRVSAPEAEHAYATGRAACAGCEDRSIRVWRVSDGAPAAEVAAWAGPVAPTRALRWAPRRMCAASGGADGALLLWLPNLDALSAAAAKRGQPAPFPAAP